MSIHADPADLVACHLDDWAAAWARRLLVSIDALARHDGEHDELYRPRLVSLVASLRR